MRLKYHSPTSYSDDKQLWRAFKSGDRHAYSLIYHQQVRLLFAYGCKLSNQRELIKDCIQDLFYYLWEHREGLSDTDNIRRYLLTALRRSLLTQLKSTAIQYPLLVNSPTTPSYETEWIEQQTAEDQLAGLTQSIQTLPDRQREAVFLKYYQNLSTEEIAATMCINRRAVYKLLAKAIANLRRSWPAMSSIKITILIGIALALSFLKEAALSVAIFA